MATSGFGAEAQQVLIHFTTSAADLQLPEEQRQLLVPSDIRRYGLSKILNSESMLDTAQTIPFDFLINGQFLRTSLEDYFKENGLSFESTITLEYVRSLLPPTYQASFEHEDWVSSVDTLSQNSRAGIWSGDKLVPGQDRVLSASYDGLLRIWNSSGSVIATSPSGSQGGHSASIKTAKFLSSSQIASAGLDRTVRLWKYNEADDHLSGTLKPTLELYGHKACVESIDVHTPTGRILSAGADGCVGLWTTSKSSAPAAPAELLPGANATKKRKVATSVAPQRGALSLNQHHSSPVSAAIFHPHDSSVAYSASQDHTIKTLDLTTSLVVTTLTTAHPLLSLCSVSGKNGLLAAGTSARHITLIDPRVSAATTSVLTLRGHRNMVTSISASPEDDHSLVSASHDGTCRVWDLRSVRTGTAAEGQGSVGESVYVIERESQKGKKKSSAAEVPGRGNKVFSVVWDKSLGIVSGGEDKQVQINRGRDLLAST
ncbi:WD40-repeat-containing domain protein [Microdochium trichocladiopsis]|uniref:Ribosome biogenesis protein YTM1 n=1 Tax=Microdochium trichocladiopsis TaxID=1682393 RepID=A0A9P9BRN2_9PEZI|nr:WD40-repeat-containing domain protein [Microdochium trichocladiopsis]KAH7032995.1 WD40-repeat-containing domain protein [Microdochium trichocladiopsis]